MTPRPFFCPVVSLALSLVANLVHAGERVVAYVPNWVDTRALAEKIDYAKITHINIAFENPANDAGDLSYSKKNEVLIAKAQANKVRVLISIGGGSASDNKTLKARYFDLLTEGKRAAFAAKLAAYVEEHHFDGLDVDIEGPSINEDYGAFITELAKALKPRGKLLTAALSKGYGGNKVPDSVFEHFDFINIMAYDGAGPWNPNSPGQHSSMDFAKSSVSYWLKRGLPKDKAVLGVPFYGYGFGEAFKKDDYAYAEIVAAYPGAENADETGKTIWYNGLPTIRAKTRYAMEQGLGGIMIWSLDADAAGDKSLLSAIYGTLHPAAPVAEGKPK
jgi:GH18 family chitinase